MGADVLCVVVPLIAGLDKASATSGAVSLVIGPNTSVLINRAMLNDLALTILSPRAGLPDPKSQQFSPQSYSSVAKYFLKQTRGPNGTCLEVR